MRMKGLYRSRWAAIGAAVAVTLGGGGLIGVSAATVDTDQTLNTVEPVRILDTRGGDKVSYESYFLKVTGEVATLTSSGEVNATVVPTGASAVSMNLTVTEGVRNANGYGFVTAFPCTAVSDDPPNASTVNFVEGVDIANSTVVPIGSTGYICLNVYGDAHLVVDVNGFYEDMDAYTKSETYTKSQIDLKVTNINNDIADLMEKAPLLTVHSGASAVPSGVRYHSSCTSGSDVNGGGNGHQLWFYPQVVEKGTITELVTCNSPVQGSVFKIPLDVMLSNGSGLDNNTTRSMSQTYAPYMYTICFDFATMLEPDSVELQAIDEDQNATYVGRWTTWADGCRTVVITKSDLDNLLNGANGLVGAPNAFGSIDFNTPVSWNLVITAKETGDAVSGDDYHLYLQGVKVYWDSLEGIQDYIDS